MTTSPNPPQLAAIGNSFAVHPLRRLWLLVRKELRETLRDRRTVITLFAMPLLLYPLLGGMFRFLLVQKEISQRPVYRLVVTSDQEVEWLARNLAQAEEALREQDKPWGDESAAGAERPHLQVVKPEDIKGFQLTAAVASQTVDVGMRISLNQQDNATTPATVQLIHCADSAASREARLYVERCLTALNRTFLERWSREQNISLRIPVTLAHTTVRSSVQSLGVRDLLPLILLLMTVTGGVYPAIDLTAGERERDTLETLIALPIPRLQLLLAKYLAIFVVTTLTGLMNLIAMMATIYALRIESLFFGDVGLSTSLACGLLIVMMVFGLFYSAILLSVTSSARSFKEAQAYLIPVMLISFAPSLVILLPGWQLEGSVTVMPLINMLLLARDVIEGDAQLGPATVAMLTTVLYAMCALAIASRYFGADAIMVGSRGGWQDLFRQPDEPRDVATVNMLVLILALIFPLHFFAGGVLSRLFSDAPTARVVTAGMMTLLLFGLLPGGVLRWNRVSISTGCQLRTPARWVWMGAVVLGLGTWPLVHEIVLLAGQLGLAPLPDWEADRFHALLEIWRQLPVVVTVISLGVIPGVCEELFFRGAFLHGLVPRLGARAAIVTTGLVFGVLHVLLGEGAAIQRLLPSTCLGLLLGWVAWRSASVWPGIVTHVLHNTSLLVLARYHTNLGQPALEQVGQQHLPTSWLVGSVLAVTIGVAGIAFSGRRWQAEMR